MPALFLRKRKVKDMLNIQHVNRHLLIQKATSFVAVNFTALIVGLMLFACNTNPNSQTLSKDTEASTQLGEVRLQVTGAAAAQPHFEKGLLLLHSFEYEDAREAFQAAQAIDSTFAMAYWGEAMTYNHSLWQQQEKEKAVAVLERLAPDAASRLALVETDLERDFLTALEILYGEGTKYERDLAYKNYLEKLSKKYPDQHEVAAFYAIALLGAARNGRDEKLYDKSARIAKGIIAENPNHPGALHYLIHSYDDPLHAFMAKDAADNYAQVAPDAAHALHMPSHIYVALGQWNDVVNSNIASWNASVKRMQAKGLEKNARSYHALNWLQYGLLQRDEVSAAKPLLERMLAYAQIDSSKRARSYLLMMKGGHLIETADWQGTFADINIDVADLNIVGKAQYAFLEGMKAYHRRDAAALKSTIDDMQQARNLAESRVGDQGFAMCSAGGYAGRPPNQLDVDMAKIMELELKAYLADLQGDVVQAKTYFEEGIAIEETLSYSFGPPDVFKPVHEAYGEYLMAQEDYAAAISVFEKALETQPRRLRSLRGKQKTAEWLKDAKAAAEAAAELAVSLEARERVAVL